MQNFRRNWDAVLKKAFHSAASYLPDKATAIYTVKQSFHGMDVSFHFDQLKIFDWYIKEKQRNSKNIFVVKKLKRSQSGVLTLDESVCRYDGKASESALTIKF